MYDALNSVFGWSETNLPKERYILISDSFTSDGSFLLNHFINMYIKGNHRVCLIGFEQSFIHYFSVCRKLGVNLLNAYRSKNFSFINAVSSPYSWNLDVSVQSDNPNIAQLQEISNSNPFSIEESNDKKNPLNRLFNMIKNIESNHQKRLEEPICIVIDNISSLLESQPYENVIDFILSCHSFIESLETKNGNSLLVVLAHGDIETQFVRSLLHQSDLSFIVSGFKSGYHSQFDGQLSFLRTSYNSDNQPLPYLLFKINENDVKFTTIKNISKKD